MAFSFEMRERLHFLWQGTGTGINKAGWWPEQHPMFFGYSSWVRYNGQSFFRPENGPGGSNVFCGTWATVRTLPASPSNTGFTNLARPCHQR